MSLIPEDWTVDDLLRAGTSEQWAEWEHANDVCRVLGSCQVGAADCESMARGPVDVTPPQVGWAL